MSKITNDIGAVGLRSKVGSLAYSCVMQFVIFHYVTLNVFVNSL